MANVADCAFAIAKDDLPKLRGAIRKARKGEQNEYIYRERYKNDVGDEIEVLTINRDDGLFLETYLNGRRMTRDKYDRDKLSNFEKNITKQAFKLDASDYRRTVKDIVVCDGWRLNWKSLKGYSYQASTDIYEYDDYIVVYFGGRWGFPETLETFLNKKGVRWQGAGCEDGCDYRYDEYGNTDFGLRVRESENEDLDDKYSYHYIDKEEI